MLGGLPVSRLCHRASLLHVTMDNAGQATRPKWEIGGVGTSQPTSFRCLAGHTFHQRKTRSRPFVPDLLGAHITMTPMLGLFEKPLTAWRSTHRCIAPDSSRHGGSIHNDNTRHFPPLSSPLSGKLTGADGPIGASRRRHVVCRNANAFLRNYLSNKPMQGYRWRNPRGINDSQTFTSGPCLPRLQSTRRWSVRVNRTSGGERSWRPVGPKGLSP